MKVRDIMKALARRGAENTRSTGSHVRYESACGRCHTTVAGTPGDDVPVGTVKKTQRDMEPCYGPGWLDV